LNKHKGDTYLLYTDKKIFNLANYYAKESFGIVLLCLVIVFEERIVKVKMYKKGSD